MRRHRRCRRRGWISLVTALGGSLLLLLRLAAAANTDISTSLSSTRLYDNELSMLVVEETNKKDPPPVDATRRRNRVRRTRKEKGPSTKANGNRNGSSSSNSNSHKLAAQSTQSVPDVVPVGEDGLYIPESNVFMVRVPAPSSAPKTMAPVSDAPMTTATPISAAPVSSAPVTSAPISSAPVAISPSPVSAGPVSLAPVSPSPVSAGPVSLAPVSVAPVTRTPVSTAPTVAPVSQMVRGSDGGAMVDAEPDVTPSRDPVTTPTGNNNNDDDGANSNSVTLPSFFMAFEAPEALRLPTNDELTEFVRRTVVYWKYAFVPLGVPTDVRYGAGLPDNRFLLYLVWDQVHYFTYNNNNATPLLSPHEAFVELQSQMTVDYLLDYVRTMEGTPFESTQALVLRELPNPSPTVKPASAAVTPTSTTATTTAPVSSHPTDRPTDPPATIAPTLAPYPQPSSHPTPFPTSINIAASATTPAPVVSTTISIAAAALATAAPTTPTADAAAVSTTTSTTTESTSTSTSIAVTVPMFLLSFVAPDATRAPTLDEYTTLVDRTQDYLHIFLGQYFAEYISVDSGVEYQSVECVLFKTGYGEDAGVPLERFNIVLGFESATVVFGSSSNGSNNDADDGSSGIPDASEVMVAMESSMTTDYVLDVVRTMEDSPWISTTEVYMIGT